ncbi:hypothetical protein HDU87_004294 [Geranomyces variabilis]|uniref:Uncharacterized protein n=1 Tax=Geranomyces variabilis TaxID=109894 RepID=A0AAD5TIR3_9FUNG|nr:hypothetical protein HDU87_004294 [Geranomyces variabilis]
MSNTQKTAPPTGDKPHADNPNSKQTDKDAEELKALKAAHPGMTDFEVRTLQAAAKDTDKTAEGLLKFGMGP